MQWIWDRPSSLTNSTGEGVWISLVVNYLAAWGAETDPDVQLVIALAR